MSPHFENAFRREAGPGLEMRLFQPADAEPIFELTEANREYLREWLPWVDRTHSAADVREFITRTVLPQWRDRLGPQCGVWVEGALAGGIGCHPIDWQNRSCSPGVLDRLPILRPRGCDALRKIFACLPVRRA